MTTSILSPLRKQGDVSNIPAAPTAVLLQDSGAPPTATISRAQGSSTSPTATLACTQGSGTSLPDTLAHSYTPIIHQDPLLASIKGRSRALMREGHAGGRADERACSLSLANACNPYCKRIPLAQDNTSRVLPPLCSISRQPIWAGTRSDNFTRRSRDPPGVETPTVGAPGRGLLRVDEQLPVELQMGSLQHPLQPGTLLRFGSLEFMSLDGSYDMVLLPPQRDNDNDGRQLARQRRTRRRLPRVCPAAFLAIGGGGGATVSRQEAAPRRLSSKSTAPAPQRGACRALSSRLRQRRVSFPRNMPTLSGQMTPALSRRTCWAFASYLR
jgi:hypothetical protein